ncbi:MAG TPA: glycosyltransferase family 4 protein [Geobacteraceae bacterium]|nr:glycosyltransferase family 4 protein [Geobacteraceae bacterium]
MKILLVNNDKGWGGGQEYLGYLATELSRSGVDAHFLVRAGSPSAERFAARGFPVHAMPRHGLRDIQALFCLVGIMRRERFDIISVNREHDIFMTYLALKLAFPFSRGGRLIMTYHIGVARPQHCLGAMDAIICVSAHVRERLLRFHPKVAAKTRVLHQGIEFAAPPEPEKFSTGRARRFFHNAGFPIIGMVGAFWKNQAELVDCIPLLKQRFPDIKVVFVGNDSELPLAVPVKEKMRAMGLEESVIFTGRVPRDRIADIFFDLDLSVSTHRNEGFGIVHLESLAAGTPVVCYNEGGQTDIFAGEDVGVMVDGGPREFSAAISDLLADDSRRFAMGKRGRNLVERNYSVEAMGEKYLRFYRELVGT